MAVTSLKPIELWHGDCLELMARIPDGSVDCVVADLPFGSTRNKWDVPVDIEEFWKLCARVCKPSAAIIMFATQPFAFHLMASNLRMFRYDLIWEKGRPVGYANARRCPLRSHETMLVFSAIAHKYNPQMTQGGRKYNPQLSGAPGSNFGDMKRMLKGNKDGEKFPRSVLRLSCVNNRTSLHPTQKPIDLFQWLVMSYTDHGDTVLDPTAGSFTTAVACVNTGRRCIGIEKDKGYFDIGVKRVKESMAGPQQGDLL